MVQSIKNTTSVHEVHIKCTLGERQVHRKERDEDKLIKDTYKLKVY